MSSLHRTPLALAVLSLLGAQSADASASLSALTIQLRDLRPGYVVAEASSRTIANLGSQQHVGAGLLPAHGWVGGYDVLYRRSENPSLQVGETADQFGNASGAQWWYGVSLLRVPATYHAVPMPSVGDESTGVESSAFLGIIFRRDKYVFDVYVSLRAPAASASVLTLSRLVDRRAQQGESPPKASLRREARTQRKTVRTQTKTARNQRRAPAMPLRAWVSSGPNQYHAPLVLYARTLPGAVCVDHIVYSASGVPGSRGGYTQVVGPSGVVSWSWAKAPTSAGKATVICTFHGQRERAAAAFARSR